MYSDVLTGVNWSTKSKRNTMSASTESEKGTGDKIKTRRQRRQNRHRLFMLSLALLVSAVMVSAVFAVQDNNPGNGDTYPVMGDGVTGIDYIYGDNVTVDGEKYALAYLYDDITDTCEVAGWLADEGYSDPIGHVVIPSTIKDGGNDVDVTSISASAFKNCTRLSSVTLSDKIDSIQENAFEGCSSLENIYISKSVTYVHFNAFAGCTGLIEIVVDPDNPTYSSRDGYLCNKAGTGMTLCPTGMSGSLTVPGYFISIERYAFNGCTQLESVTILSNVTSIGEYAFRHCTGLASVEIPDNIPFISEGMFFHCTGLASFVMSDSIEEIGNYAFYGCTGLESVTMSENLEKIGNYAFYGCEKLTSVDIPDGVLSIGEFAFRECIGLTSVTIPGSTEILGRYVFDECAGLTSVNMSEGIVEIGIGAFCDCAGLTTVTVPASVEIIGESAFKRCYGLTSATMLGEVTSIGESAFFDCYNLTTLIFWEIPGSFGSDCFSLGTEYRHVTCTVYSFIEDENNRFLDPYRGGHTNFAYEKYTDRIVFEMNGHGEQIDVQKIELGEPSVKPEDPSETGYIFGGWFENPNLSGEAFVFGELVEGHITLYAKWTPIIYTVTFKSDGAIVQVSDLEYGSLIFAPSVIPTKAAKDGVEYEFMKWEDYWEGMTVTGDVTFVAIFYEWGGDTPAGSEDDPGEEFPILYAAVAVVAVIAISLVAVFVRRM